MSSAQVCTGDPGFELEIIPPEVGIGTIFGECLTMPAGDWTAYIIISLTTGTTPTVAGELCVGVPFLALLALPVPPSGELCLSDRMMPCDPALVGIVAYWQYVAVSNTLPKVYGVSNLASLTIIDSSCDCDVDVGDFVTYTQGGWNAPCNGTNPGCILDDNFASVFPSGLLIGDQDGLDGDAFFALLLTSSTAVQDFLTQGGPPSTLDADLTDPTDSSAGVFAGQLVAATLNVGFDDAGVFDSMKLQTSLKLGDLVFVQGVNPALIGMTVREVIDLSNLAISGELTEPIDVDGDMIGDVTIADLNTALALVNLNFDNGTTNNGDLCVP